MNTREVKLRARQRLLRTDHQAVTRLFVLLGLSPLLFYCASFFVDLYTAGLPGGFSNMGTIRSLRGIASLFSALTTLTNLAISLTEYGYLSFWLKRSRDLPADASELKLGFQHFGKFCMLLLLNYALVFVWSLLFFIPGIIATYRYRMAPYILMDNPTITPMEAIHRSAEMTRGNKHSLFELDLRFWYVHVLLYAAALLSYLNLYHTFSSVYAPLLLNLGSCLIQALVYLWRLPYLTAANTEAYRTLCGESGSSANI